MQAARCDDDRVKNYHNARAPEYDEWYLGLGVFAGRDRPGWEEALEGLVEAIAGLPPAHTLDVACGTGFLTRHLAGEITGLDQSARMLVIARQRMPDATFLQGDALRLPFEDDAFDQVFTGHFYGHLQPGERARFLAEARRTASELVVADTALQPDHEPEEWQERVLNGGSRFTVYKRYLDADQLAAELGGGAVLHSSRWFVMVSSRR
jgi:demethylmenaquinone methyltransferase/2-methoxy-6-polyprenyl-1,4-benzoquinol methylase